MELVRLPADDAWQTTAAEITEAHERRVAHLAARPEGPHTARRRQALDRGYADVLSTLPYDADATPMFALHRA
ncbi:hypothetical protein [Streptomyces formicae]